MTIKGKGRYTGTATGIFKIVDLTAPDAGNEEDDSQTPDLPQTDNLPRTGDPSMLGAAGAGLKLRRKN